MKLRMCSCRKPAATWATVNVEGLVSPHVATIVSYDELETTVVDPCAFTLLRRRLTGRCVAAPERRILACGAGRV